MNSIAQFAKREGANDYLVNRIDDQQGQAISVLNEIIAKATRMRDALNGDENVAWMQVLHDDNVVGASGTIGTLFEKYNRCATLLVNYGFRVSGRAG